MQKLNIVTKVLKKSLFLLFFYFLDASMYLYKLICPSFHLSICPSIHPSICRSSCPSVQMSIMLLAIENSVFQYMPPFFSLDASTHLCKRVCLTVHPLVRPTVHPSVCLSIHLNVHLQICPSTCQMFVSQF